MLGACQESIAQHCVKLIDRVARGFCQSLALLVAPEFDQDAPAGGPDRNNLGAEFKCPLRPSVKLRTKRRVRGLIAENQHVGYEAVEYQQFFVTRHLPVFDLLQESAMGQMPGFGMFPSFRKENMEQLQEIQTEHSLIWLVIDHCQE